MDLPGGETQLLAAQRRLVKKEGERCSLVTLAVSQAGDIPAQVAKLDRNFDKLPRPAQHVFAGGVFGKQRAAPDRLHNNRMVGSTGVSAMMQLGSICRLGMNTGNAKQPYQRWSAPFHACLPERPPHVRIENVGPRPIVPYCEQPRIHLRAASRFLSAVRVPPIPE